MKTNRKYGAPELLPQRMADWLRRVKHDGSLPWAGLGICKDLEAVVRLLSLQEFADWLRTHPNPDLAEWARAVQEAADERDSILATIDENLPKGDTATDAIITAATELDAIRGVLIETGALSAGDTETDVPALIRALLA